MLKENATAETKNITVLYCSNCGDVLFICKRCGFSFNRFEKVSCDEGHRCTRCLKKSKDAEASRATPTSKDAGIRTEVTL